MSASADYDAIPASAITRWRDGRAYDGDGVDVTEQRRLAEQNGTTLRHALKAHGLAVSGTKRQQAARLADAEVTAEHVIEHHGWRARTHGHNGLDCRPEKPMDYTAEHILRSLAALAARQDDDERTP